MFLVIDFLCLSVCLFHCPYPAEAAYVSPLPALQLPQSPKSQFPVVSSSNFLLWSFSYVLFSLSLPHTFSHTFSKSLSFSLFLSFSLSLFLSFFLSLFLSFSLSYTHSLTPKFSHPHSLTHTFSHTHILSRTHSLTPLLDLWRPIFVDDDSHMRMCILLVLECKADQVAKLIELTTTVEEPGLAPHNSQWLNFIIKY